MELRQIGPNRSGRAHDGGFCGGLKALKRPCNSLVNTFCFHPLAVDDALEESHVPKLDDWGEYLYIVMHAAAIQPKNFDIETLEMDIFLGRNYIVTHHDHPIE
jgi:Mg2+ and Co2+ transporter CorA